MKKKKISILIPCFNEEKGIGKVISAIPFEKFEKEGYAVDVIVIDNNSTDNTAMVASQKNVTVIFERKKGKGAAIKAGIEYMKPDTNFVVMLDGDNTYKASEIPRLIEPLENDFCDAIIGSRLGGKIKKNALKLQNRIANWVYTFLVRQFYRANTTDVLSGYFAWKYEVIKDLEKHMQFSGFSFEMEMITKLTKLGYELYSVPITYDQRAGDSKLDSIKDGLIILFVFFKNIFWIPNFRTRQPLGIRFLPNFITKQFAQSEDYDRS